MSGRSSQQNAFYWRTLERAVERDGRWKTTDELHAALRIAAGYVDRVILLDGRRVLVPRSTRFGAMTHEEAQHYYDAAFNLLSEILGADVHELDQ